MKHIFDEQKLKQLAQDNCDQYRSTYPYPHIFVDNFLEEGLINNLVGCFPTPQQMDFYKYDNPLEKKLAMDQIHKFPEVLRETLVQFNSPVFLHFLEQLTGIDGLIPDPYYRGGGIHQVESGGKLDIHVDFNKHPKLNLVRRLTAILFLNKNWEENYGGSLEIWKGHKKNGQHILEECTQKILPIANRFVLFNTSETSYHGHPEPLQCPAEMTRKSLAVYYYTSSLAFDEEQAHSTTFVKRPHDPENKELDLLREIRNKGRIASNI